MNTQTETQVATSDAIKFGDTIYLEHMSGRYITASDPGTNNRYDWPRLGGGDKVKFEIVGNSEGELTDGSIIKLKSTELKLGDRNLLGAFADSHDCYYWSDCKQTKKFWEITFKEAKQNWRISKKDRNGDNTIRYGDEVYLTNLHYKNQRLSRDSWYDGYITTVPYANEWWTIKAEGTQDNVGISSEALLLRRLFEPRVKGYSAANMAYMAYCAEAAYGSPEVSKAKLEQLGFTINGTEHFIDLPGSDTQCLVVGDAEKIIIAFRGTENLKDWRTDLELLKSVWKIGVGAVHKGFYEALESVLSQVIDRIKQLRTNNQPLWFTGHSLGGALAALACATFCQDKDRELTTYETAGIYTFGQPRIGDRIFTKAFDAEARARYFRVVNNNDIVPRIPNLGYQHGGNLVYFDAFGNFYNNAIVALWNPLSWWRRLQGYYASLFNLDSDDIGDHRMGDYRILTMRQLEKR